MEKLGVISLTECSGVSKTVIKEGCGEHPTDGMEVSVHYVGKLLDGTEFDSSRAKNTPFSLTLGEGSTIKGFDIGIKSMKVGEKCNLFCKAPFAYGEAGSGEKIPPNATLNFEMELLTINFKDISGDGSIRQKLLHKGESSYDGNINDGSKCKVKISGKVKDSTKTFWQESEREIVVGDDNEPLGLDAMLKKMEKGGKSVFLVSPGKNHFSGKNLPKSVCANDTLEISIEILSVELRKEVWQMSNKEKLEAAIASKQRGNELLKSEKRKLASAKYEYSISCLEQYPGVFPPEDIPFPMKEEEEEDKEEEERRSKLAKETIVASFNNLSLIKMKEKNFEAVVSNCEKALRADEENAKARYKLVVALKSIGSFKAAQEHAIRLLLAEPKNSLFKNLSVEIKRSIIEERNEIRSLYKSMAVGLA